MIVGWWSLFKRNQDWSGKLKTDFAIYFLGKEMKANVSKLDGAVLDLGVAQAEMDAHGALRHVYKHVGTLVEDQQPSETVREQRIVFIWY
jgi:hypothetical protein